MGTLINTMLLLLRLADTVSLDEAAGTDGWCHEIAAITTQLAYAGDRGAFCAGHTGPDYSGFCGGDAELLTCSEICAEDDGDNAEGWGQCIADCTAGRY